MNPISRIVRFRARPETAAALTDALLTTADTLAETSGCKSWEVHQGTPLTHYRLTADRRLGWAHRHNAAEETYVVIAGSARMKVDDELFALERLDAVRIAPRSVREFEAGPEGVEMLAFGTHIPGDGEMVADWWSD